MFPVLGLITALTPWLERIFPNPDERERQKAELESLLTSTLAQLDIAQTDVNKAEAASSNLFVAGWRPFVGWVCGAAFAYHFILQPLLAFILANAGHEVTLPAFDMETLTTVLMGLLGLGSLRTIEKIRGA